MAKGKISVWKRKYPDSSDTGQDEWWTHESSFKRMFSHIRVNRYLDIYVKRAALKAAPSVVCVEIYSGKKEIRSGSGIIIENSQSEAVIITSASLLKVDDTHNSLLDDLKVVVVLWNGKEHKGDVAACDYHYNLAAIKIQLNHSLEMSRLRDVDDRVIFDPSEAALRPCSNLFPLISQTKVIALGRYNDNVAGIMVAPGLFSSRLCRLDCKELMVSTCRTTKCGIGGPLINYKGEVIGVNFFALEFTPFLPINMVSKWWNHYKKFEDYCRPWLGMKLVNLSTVEVSIWEKISQNFPNTKKGIVIVEVTPHSPADVAGLHPSDMIVECDGNVVDSSLQFFELAWEKIDKVVELIVIRNYNSRVLLSLTIVDTSPDQFNRWPLPGR